MEKKWTRQDTCILLLIVLMTVVSTLLRRYNSYFAPELPGEQAAQEDTQETAETEVPAESAREKIARTAKALREKEREEYLLSLEGDGVWKAFAERNYVLLGDSRFVGFSAYGFLEEDRVLANNGAVITKILDHLEEFERLAPEEVYIAFGINDILTGIWPTPESYADEVLEEVTILREYAPDAAYCFSSILPAVGWALEENPVFEEVDAYNEAVRDMCARNDILYIEEDGKAKYAVVPIELFDQLEDVLTMMNTPFDTSVRIAAPDEIDLTYDEYERIKKQIMEAVEKTFMPKPEKLN